MVGNQIFTFSFGSSYMNNYEWWKVDYVYIFFKNEFMMSVLFHWCTGSYLFMSCSIFQVCYSDRFDAMDHNAC